MSSHCAPGLARSPFISRCTGRESAAMLLSLMRWNQRPLKRSPWPQQCWRRCSRNNRCGKPSASFLHVAPRCCACCFWNSHRCPTQKWPGSWAWLQDPSGSSEDAASTSSAKYWWSLAIDKLLLLMLTIRSATINDTPVILDFIRRLAEYEREPDAVVATEEDLKRDGFGPEPKYRCVI